MVLRNFAGAVGQKLIRYAAGNSNMVRHAKDEWALAYPEKDKMQDAVKESVLDVLAIFSLAHHSGFSAAYTIGRIEKLLRFEPLGPLTGEDSEWMEIGEEYPEGDGQHWWQQNKRCSHVFRGPDGAYDINGRVFIEPSGASYAGPGSRVPITFPYTPTTEYIHVDDAGEPISNPAADEVSAADYGWVGYGPDGEWHWLVAHDPNPVVEDQRPATALEMQLLKAAGGSTATIRGEPISNPALDGFLDPGEIPVEEVSEIPVEVRGMPFVESLERVRHIKRGTEYDVLGFAELQSEEFYGPTEGALLVIYRGADGKIWAREDSEFNDGRFKRINRGEG